MPKQWIRAFWEWYERHYVTNLVITTILFLFQLIHLYWLATDVIAFRIMGTSFFTPSDFWKTLIIIVDYTEIPALLSASLIYFYDILYHQFRWRYLLLLISINSQWLHLFWITDEFVMAQFRAYPTGTMLPLWLAWVAIGIDYLELPVVIDTVARLLRSALRHRLLTFLRREARYHIWHI